MEFKHLTLHHLDGDVSEDNLPAMMATLLEEIKKTGSAELRSKNIELTKQLLRESVTPDANMVHAINAIEEIDKVANTLVKRLREWYALYDPETEHRLTDHETFVQEVLTQPNRALDSMGGELSDKDRAMMNAQAAAINALYQQRQELLAYLEEIMLAYAPNLRKVAGAMIGAKLIAMAGSLKRLSRLPSGTIQLLGAETALFRHLRNKNARPPKHGIIFNHVLLQRAPKPMRGKMARAIADAACIASKVDYFKGEYVGDTLYAKIEAHVK